MEWHGRSLFSFLKTAKLFSNLLHSCPQLNESHRCPVNIGVISLSLLAILMVRASQVVQW